MRPLTTAATLAFSLLAASPALAQLDPPPGPVSPTFKTLDQIEPSIPIGPDTTPGDEDSVYKITQKGHYHLTGSIHEPRDGFHVIEIAASGVTLDLRGYTVRTNNIPSLSTIHAAGWSNVTVKNGYVEPHRNGLGIDLAGGKWNVIENIRANYGLCGIDAGSFATVRNCRIVRSLQAGIRVGDGSLVENCIIYDSPYNGTNAIETGESAIVRNCTIDRWDNIGILPGEDTKISGCTIRDVGFAGIYVDLGATIKDTTISHCDGWGIYALNDAVIEECDISHNAFDGIRAYNRCRIINNICDSNGHEQDQGYAGIYVLGPSNIINDNTCRDNYTYGIYVGSGLNTILRNHGLNNNDDFRVLAPDQNHWAGEVRPGQTSANPNTNYRD